MTTNGAVHAHDQADQNVMMSPQPARDFLEVVGRMMLVVPVPPSVEGEEPEPPDQLVLALNALSHGHRLCWCKEAGEQIAWQQVMGILAQRAQMFGKKKFPDWFLHAAAIFRGDA